MNLKKVDLGTLRSLRKHSWQTVKDVDKEIDRRLDLERGKVKVEEVPVSQLASKEGMTSDGIIKRCKRAGIPITDKDGNPSRAGHRAYVNMNMYNLYY